MRRTYTHDYGTCRSRAPVPVRAVDARFLRSRHWGGRLRAAERVHRLPEEAMQTWLNIEDDPQVLEDEIELELQAVEEDLANKDVEDDDVLSEEEGAAVGQSRA